MKSRGTTLIETLTYISVLVMVFGIFTNIVLSAGRSYLALAAARKLDMAAISATERITREIRTSSAADVSTPGTLNLGGTSFSTTTDNNIQVRIDSVDQGVLLPSGVNVSAFILSKIDSGQSQAVKVEMQLADRKYYSTVILRGTYK